MACTRSAALALALAISAGACGDDEEHDAAADAGGAAPASPASGPPNDAAPPADAAAPVPDVPPEVEAHARDWVLPNYDYDNTRASFSAEIRADNIEQLAEAWRVPMPGRSAFGAVTSNPLVVGDTVLIQDMQGTVFAIDRDSGAQRWKRADSLPTVGPNGVAVGWGKVFACRGDVGFIALALDDGRELWRHDPVLVSSEGVDIQPLAYGGRVYVSTVPGSLRGPYLGGSRGILLALDQHSGDEVWRFDTVDSTDLWGSPDENAGGGAWYPPAIDADRGALYWGTGNPAPWPGTASAPNGSSRPGDNLYTSGLLALQHADGELAWFHQEKPHDLFDWDFQNSPILVRGAGEAGDVIIGSGKTGTVVALAPDGALLWRTEVGAHENDDLDELPAEGVEVLPGIFGGVLTPPAYADGVVYAPVVNLASTYGAAALIAADLDAGTGELVALEIEHGGVLWSAPLPQPAYGGALVVNDLVLTSDGGGGVYAFAREDGAEVWSWQAPGGINAPMAVAGDLLLVPVGLADAPELIALRLN